MSENSTFPFVQDVDACLADAIGAAGLSRDQLEAALDAVVDGVATLRRRWKDGSLPLLDLPSRRDDIDSLTNVAGELTRHAKRVTVLGTGGSSLGGQALCSLATADPSEAGRVDVRFADNLDPVSLSRLVSGPAFEQSAFIVISKSGSTVETVAQYLVCHEALCSRLGSAAARSRFVIVTQPGDSTLRRLATAHDHAIIDHDPGVGGRFSVLTAVGLLPAALAGLDVAAVREGAGLVLDQLVDRGADRANARVASPVIGAALALGQRRRGTDRMPVLMAYADRLAPFTRWYRQLWAESLGKDGKGTTPLDALGPVDQHSQLQLYLDGPDDKTFTVIVLSPPESGPVIARVPAAAADFSYLSGRSIGDIVKAQQEATIETLKQRGRPIRLIRLGRADERSIGALFMHFMIETILTAFGLGIDPFDQPAVESGKVLARQILSSDERTTT
jgi:glucose-6-phosphate isomerase